jgi:outer membrane receptor protein involved in Fe transport
MLYDAMTPLLMKPLLMTPFFTFLLLMALAYFRPPACIAGATDSTRSTMQTMVVAASRSAQDSSSQTPLHHSSSPQRTQQPAQRLYKLRPVDISSVSLGTDYSSTRAQVSAIMPVSPISAPVMQMLGARQISDALNFVPGLFIRNYGGLGGLKTVSMRGANASQTLVLVDGVRMNSAQSGQIDLSLIPLSMLDGIEVLRGGAAALYGAAAMGGVINIRTKRAQPPPSLYAADSLATIKTLHAQAQAEIASFGEQTASAEAIFRVGINSPQKSTASLAAWNLGINADFQRSDGTFPFRFNEFGRDTVMQRQNGDFQTASARLHANATLQGWTLNTQVLLRSSERGTPGAVVQGSVEQARARLRDDEFFAAVAASTSLAPPDNVLLFPSTFWESSWSSTLRLTSSWRAHRFRYRDPDARTRGINGIDEEFTGNDIALKAEWRTSNAQQATSTFTLSSAYDLTVHCSAAAELLFSDVRGAMFQPNVGSYISRTNAAVSSSIEMLFSERAAMHLGGRVDWFSDLAAHSGVVFSPLAGVSFALLDKSVHLKSGMKPSNVSSAQRDDNDFIDHHLLSLRSQWSYNFRPPAFNELYYLNFGNANLLPERGHSLGLGAVWSWRMPMWTLVAELDGFANFTTNQIIAVPTSPVTWSAQNIGFVRTIGVEHSMKVQSQFGSTIQASLTVQQATDETEGSFSRGKLLIYTPQHLASVVLAQSWSWFRLVWNAGMSVQWTAERFSLPSNTQESRLADFGTMNIFLELGIPLWSAKASVRLQCDNLFDARYAVLRNFPMPGRALRFTLRAAFPEQLLAD